MLCIGLLVAIGVGRLYAIISQINPIIYLNFLILGGVFFLLTLVIASILGFAKSRNRLVNIIIVILICSTAWLAHWAHIFQNKSSKHNYSNEIKTESFWNVFFSPLQVIGKISDFANNRNLNISSLRTYNSGGMGISPAILTLLYLVEFLVFLAPVVIVGKQKSYHCEDCDAALTEKQGYMIEPDIFSNKDAFMAKGDFTFLEPFYMHKNLDEIPLDPKDKPAIAIVRMHSCPSCANSIINVKTTSLKYDDKKKRETSLLNSNYIIEDTYVTKQTQELLNLKLWKS
jgi:hypothetical protein